MALTERLSPHFSRREMTVTQVRGVDNEPNEAQWSNLARVCWLLMEPIRSEFGPILVTSGYRSPLVNVTVGGSTSSAHMDGRACDFVPMDPAVELDDVMAWVVASDLPFDQAILEYGRWLHCGIARSGEAPRKQALRIDKPGRYRPFEVAA